MAKIQPSRIRSITTVQPVGDRRTGGGKVAGVVADRGKAGVWQRRLDTEFFNGLRMPRTIGPAALKKALDANQTEDGVGLPKALRLVNLVQYLLRHSLGVEFRDILGIYLRPHAGSDPNRVNERVRKRRESTARKAFERDVQSLAHMGVVVETRPFDADSTKRRYFLSKRSALARPLQLGPVDCLLIQNMLQQFSGYLQSDFGVLMMSAATKLLVGQDAAHWIGHGGASGTQRALATRKAQNDAAAICFSALAQRQCVTFEYRASGTAKALERIVEVYGVGHLPRGTYMVGRDTQLGEVRVFKLSRIRGGVRPTGPKDAYQVPADFLLDRYLPRGLYPGEGRGTHENCQVRFSPELAFLIHNEFEGVHTIEEEADGSVVLTIERAYASELFRFLCEYAGHFQVIGPPALKHELLARAQETMSRYSGFRGRRL